MTFTISMFWTGVVCGAVGTIIVLVLLAYWWADDRA